MKDFKELWLLDSSLTRNSKPTPNVTAINKISLLLSGGVL